MTVIRDNRQCLLVLAFLELFRSSLSKEALPGGGVRGRSGLRCVGMRVIEGAVRVFASLRSGIRGGEKNRCRWENEHVQGGCVGCVKRKC